MSDREKLATTLGILMAGLLEAEEAAAESQRRPGRSLNKESGVYAIGDALYASDMPPESDRPETLSDDYADEPRVTYRDLNEPV